ncbi:tail fiber assembly protein [Citrobacter freundii]|uniref:tail fiber assembly protein n=1 Tax=Citrobacter freundii TaxID=546 RepID=UPI0034D62F44
MLQAQLNEDSIAITAGVITVHNFDGITREYLSSTDEYLAVGVGIPALSCIEKPSASKPGFSVCRTAELNAWEYVIDHRGETIYSTDSGKEIVVNDLGDYPAGTTTVARPTPYDKWDGSKWVLDVDAKKEADIAAAELNQRQLLAYADAVTADWRTELALGEISDGDKVRLSEWMAYKRDVKAVNAEDAAAPGYKWPPQPAL